MAGHSSSCKRGPHLQNGLARAPECLSSKQQVPFRRYLQVRRACFIDHMDQFLHQSNLTRSSSERESCRWCDQLLVRMVSRGFSSGSEGGDLLVRICGEEAAPSHPLIDQMTELTGRDIFGSFSKIRLWKKESGQTQKSQILPVSSVEWS